MDTFIVALIVLAAVIAVFKSFAKTFKSGEESPCGCGSACSGCSAERNCGDGPGNSDRVA
jgi:hypothetical protein